MPPGVIAASRFSTSLAFPIGSLAVTVHAAGTPVAVDEEGVHDPAEFTLDRLLGDDQPRAIWGRAGDEDGRLFSAHDSTFFRAALTSDLSTSGPHSQQRSTWISFSRPSPSQCLHWT